MGVRQKQDVFNKFRTSSLHTNEQFVLENVLSILFYYYVQSGTIVGINFDDYHENFGSENQ